jgi:PAS domain S-box-containing protein
MSDAPHLQRWSIWRLSPLSIFLIYVALGELWIAWSGDLAHALAPDAAQLALFEFFKGTLYVAATGGLLYLATRRLERQMQRANAKVAESEARFRRLAENAPDVIYRLRLLPTPQFEYVSPAITSVSGYTPEEFYADPLLTHKLVFPDDRACLEQARDGTITWGHPLPLRWTRKDGVDVWVEIHHTPVHDTDGRQIAIEGVARDITDRVRAERELHMRARQQEAVAQLGLLAVSDASLDAIMDAAARAVADTLAVDYSVVLAYEPDRRHLRLRAGVGWEPGLVGTLTVTATPGTPAGYVPATGEPVVYEDLATETRFTPLPFMLGLGIVSGLGMAIGGRVAPFGLLSAHTRTRRSFTRDDVVFLQAMANVLGEAAQHRQAAAALRKSEARFRQVIETANEGICFLDVQYCFTFVNQQLACALGYAAEELLGVSLNTLIFPEDLAEAQEYIDRRRQGIAETFEWRFRRKDGSEIWFINSASPIMHEEAGFAGSFVMCTDITERKRAEAALRESEERYRRVLETTHEGVCFFDRDFRFTYTNIQLARALRYDVDALLGTLFTDYLFPEDLGDFQQRAGHRRQGISDSFERRLRRQDGREVWFIISATPILDAAGQFVGSFTMLTDITERKRAEARLRELEDVVNRSPAVAFVWRMEEGWPVDFVTDNILQFGYLPGELMGAQGHPFASLVHPDDLERVTREVEQYLAAGAVEFQQEYRLLAKTGKARWVDDRTWVRRAPDGSITHLQGVLVDITERRMAERAVVRERDRARLYLDISGVLIIALDREGRVTMANRRTCEALGYREAELLGRDWFAIAIAPTEREAIRAVLAAAMAGTHVPSTHFEHRLVTRAGKEILIVAHNTLLYDDEGQICGLLGSGIDVTEHRKAEQALRESEERYRTLIESAPIAVMVNRDDQITLVNDACLRLFGATDPAQLLGKSPFDLFHPDDHALIRARIVRLQEFGEVVPMQREQIVRLDGTTVDVEVTAAPFKDQGINAIHVVLRDISERVVTEKRQQLSAEILGILNDPLAVTDAIQRILAAIQRATGFDAIGIRLRHGDDYPYLVQHGFSAGFLLTENSLTIPLPDGGLCRDAHGEICLECTCGMVIRGQADAPNPFLTPGGSFWTNDALPLLTMPANVDPRLHPRNHCIHQGYLSVALIPISANGEMLGLLQLNDQRKDCFTLEDIHYYESMTASIGVALARAQAEDALREQATELRAILDATGDGILAVDTAGRVLQANERYAEIWGIPPDVLASRDDQALLAYVQDRLVNPVAFLARVEHLYHSDAVSQDLIPLTGDATLERFSAPMFQDGVKIGRIWSFRDITERVQAEEALRESEERSRTILRTAMDGFWVVDLAGRLLEVNETYGRMTGYSEAELLAMRIADLEAGKTANETATHIDRILTLGEDRFETRHRRKDGSIVDVEVSAQFRPSGDGQFVAFIQDITERKQAAERLAASHALLANLAQLVPGVIYQYRLDPNGHSAFPYASPGMNLIYEVTPEEVQDDALPVFARLHPDDADRVAADIFASARTLEEFYCEFRVLLPRQGLRWRWSQAHPQRTEDGGTLWHGIILDITEHKQAELALEESVQRLETLNLVGRDILAAETIEAIAFSALARVRSIVQCHMAQMALFNETSTEMLVYRTEEGGSAQTITATQAALPPLCLTHLADGGGIEPNLTQAPVHTSLGSSFMNEGYHSMLCVPLEATGKLYGMLTLAALESYAFTDNHFLMAQEVATDLAIAVQQARLQEQIQRHAKELEQRVAERTAALTTSNAELESFAYIVSHDLRAPLRAMNGFAGALLEDCGSTLDETGRNYVARITGAAERMDTLILDILIYSRLGRTEMLLGTVALRDVVQEALREVAGELQSRGGRVRNEVPALHVTAHHASLVRAVSNLLQNAAKFTAPGTTPAIHVWAERHKGLVRLWVEDTGLGIATEHHERIFRVFERLHGIEAYPGTGIGLAIVRRVVERMGGHCGVESTLGVGSRFWIELAAAKKG